MCISDPEYFLAAAHSHECGGVPESVWKCESDGDRGACDPGDGGEYAGGGYFLQSDGWEAEDVSSSLLYAIKARGWTLSKKNKRLLRSKVFWDILKKKWILEFKKYMRYMRMEENIKNIASEVNEELIKLFGGKIERIILYGSYARGDFNLESDVDIMILLNCEQKEITERRKEISRIASRIGLKNDIMVSLLARNYTDYKNQMKYQPFYQNIEKEGMNIYG